MAELTTAPCSECGDEITVSQFVKDELAADDGKLGKVWCGDCGPGDDKDDLTLAFSRPEDGEVEGDHD